MVWKRLKVHYVASNTVHAFLRYYFKNIQLFKSLNQTPRRTPFHNLVVGSGKTWWQIFFTFIPDSPRGPGTPGAPSFPWKQKQHELIVLCADNLYPKEWWQQYAVVKRRTVMKKRRWRNCHLQAYHQVLVVHPSLSPLGNPVVLKDAINKHRYVYIFWHGTIYCLNVIWNSSIVISTT